MFPLAAANQNWNVTIQLDNGIRMLQASLPSFQYSFLSFLFLISRAKRVKLTGKLTIWSYVIQGEMVYVAGGKPY
jgi:hypothetical protein